MTPQPLTLDPFVEGDLWDGIPGIEIKIGPEKGPFVAPEVSIASATMRFIRAGRDNSAVVELSSATPGQITITDAAGWALGMPKQVVTGLTHGDWDWQIRIVDTNGFPLTYFADTVTVLRKI